jgi:hypothetical protein
MAATALATVTDAAKDAKSRKDFNNSRDIALGEDGTCHEGSKI